VGDATQFRVLSRVFGALFNIKSIIDGFPEMTPVAWTGILVVALCVFVAHRIGFSAGFEAGRNDGFSEGRKEGSRDGSRRGYAVGFDRGRRRGESEDEEGGGNEPRLNGIAVAAIGLLLAALVILMVGRSPESAPSIPVDVPEYSGAPTFSPSPTHDDQGPSID